MCLIFLAQEITLAAAHPFNWAPTSIQFYFDPISCTCKRDIGPLLKVLCGIK